MKAVIMKYMKTITASIILAFMITSCSTQEIPVSEIEFFIAKEWKLESLIGNGEIQTEEIIKANNPAHSLSFYRLDLNKDFTFSRTGIDSQIRSGTWSLTAGLSQLILTFDDTYQEHYLLLNLEVRRLEMRVLQDPGKVGELDIRYILEPVKGQ
jgi:hypothetical protein